LIDPDYMAQIWLNEAVADYFGSSTISRDKKGRLVVEPGRLQTDRTLTVQQAIEKGDDIHLRELFEIERDDFHAFEYAHAWSFIYFLNNADPKYKKAFDSFFKDIYTLKKGIDYEIVGRGNQSGTGKRIPPKEIERVVLAALKVKGDDGVEQLNEEWKAFIAEIPIEGPDARFKRGYQAVMRGQILESKESAAKAREDLEAAIESGLVDARAWWARGVLRILGQDWKSAREDFEQAVEMDPLNPNYRFDLGRVMTGTFSIGGSADLDDDDVRGVSKFPDARESLGLAAELAPENEYYRKFYDQFIEN
jgi:tetratricopeptide (TPR) repeat protein